MRQKFDMENCWYKFQNDSFLWLFSFIGWLTFRYGVSGSYLAVCSYPLGVENIDCITCLENDNTTIMQIIVSGESKILYSNGKSQPAMVRIGLKYTVFY